MNDPVVDLDGFRDNSNRIRFRCRVDFGNKRSILMIVGGTDLSPNRIFEHKTNRKKFELVVNCPNSVVAFDFGFVETHPEDLRVAENCSPDSRWQKSSMRKPDS